ncbi:MAG TPA: DUF6790 family protein [Roseiarcus sp.]|jgi:hypothetical protein|nr:DUF6790 family protein [Roseiarcus sp.]
MMAETIAFALRNLPLFLFVAGLALAAARRTGAPEGPDRSLGGILLLPIGVTGVWAAVFHLVFPQIAAADIGWEVSPFEFEVGLADLAIGGTASASFWHGLDFKAAAVLASSIFLLGDAIGHVKQMIVAGNFAPGNAGVPFYSDMAFPVLAIILLMIVRRSQAAPRISWKSLRTQ